ncbi:hypothetical protein COT75_04095 [Candidatus Beckwithbacteria bacterium CG10_big_fil_rev_8_21_14_0_10_34_10]|uniref:Uncharacterized protein n=1 Tax=Candidatus Beckwithbacteria bacterium CG10_big_fil_rev_8_21_14_0_10_34_10 TaxID=1974495 RepID=A0A2H0W8L9_9BACT|nr:MAG: hypothetical protein COT75_04095 [Candidatus Beckwithbacteria bacterium CG10_big_fil_rev_8_21_14_0_10_34_10]
MFLKEKYLKEINKKDKGVALISVLAITAITLIVISAVTLVSIINAKIGLNQFQSQKINQAVEALIDDQILSFIRNHENLNNPYPNWTEDCLQIESFTCKMEFNLDEAGGFIDFFGKMDKKIRHWQVDFNINEDESVSVSARKEIY